MSKVLRYAMNVLAVRDHSEMELRRKIAAHLQTNRECDNADECSVLSELNTQIEQVVDSCRQQGWLDDARYALRYISSRCRKGYGTQRICAELSQRGIDKSTQRMALQSCDIDWYLQAKAVATRKFGSPLPMNWPERAKVQRYLLYRGFSHDEIQSVYMNFSD
ncbi:recombination regulator RecX [Dickeya solani]|uniref:Regulatory protein RecX n=1 Tax=Dickeya solani TaxID=1089444 RepID=A0ABU4EFW1_9GAMM|nr:recombination regulator RecX [Dickeya solani]MCA6999995.1 recombination regulator RecX [Dickeya solani]MCZ0821400.1 recombination regulator RecX [Dickeya solani]MDV6995386.1 recombination regulator RecX [Dickeya solani]MDV7005008.1 recombination regulator RecX [Dickeya solani]MDV7040015.1 recombination regulator RecX [Dickeya solani]